MGKIAGFQRDEVYIGTAEERRKQEMGDDNAQLRLGTGHLVKLPGFSDNAPKALQKLLLGNTLIVLLMILRVKVVRVINNGVSPFINCVVDNIENSGRVHSYEE